MTVAIFEPFSGVSGDMTLGALVDLGLPGEWLESLPGRLGLEQIGVRVQRVLRAGISCVKVDFDIPPQPHGRHLKHLHAIVERCAAPVHVKEQAKQVFTDVATCEAAIHGVSVERVHLHEVGAVDAILDVLGATWGLHELGVQRVYCGPISLGDGFVTAAHGVLPVPAPATLRLLEGQVVRPGPPDSGELVTPTGAALIRALSAGPPPLAYRPTASGYGAGTKEFRDRANALRIVLAEEAGSGSRESLVILATDVDDMSPEHLAIAVEQLRDAGAVDVWVQSTLMKKGRAGVRVEVLCRPQDAERLEGMVFRVTSTIGVRRSVVERLGLAREERVVRVLDHDVRLKVVDLPDGGRRAKPEADDVERVVKATGHDAAEVAFLARSALERP